MAISLASQTKLTAKRTGKRFKSIPPLENGDRLNRDEFERRYEAMPSLKKAELIEGVVHLLAHLPNVPRLQRSDTLPLENGDFLTRDEFERRYQAMPNVKKAELIKGRVYMPSPVRQGSHGRMHSQIMLWLGTYYVATPGLDLGDNATVRLGIDEVQPDALLRLEPEHGGRSHINEEDYIEGPPELIVEIASSSTSYDLHEKRDVYRVRGVREYLGWQVYDERIDWFQLVNDEYAPLAPDESGMIRSQVFPGLQLDVEALLDGDMVKVLAVLQQGLQTSEHAAFVARLAQSSSAPG